ncbi:MAG: sulfite exporter TauE/SafE family protein [Lactobacillus porci]|nr:sulfite exporter TauE/SafE family protein [Lactobacillus porci]
MLIVYLIILGILAGIVSSVASMASLVSYPGLLLVGLSPVVANMTNTASLVTTGFGALTSCLKEMKGHWRELAWYSLFQLSGAAIGGWLLSAFPGEIFKKIVPFLVLMSGGLLVWSGRRPIYTRDSDSKLKLVLAYLGLFMAGIYAGYFGAASGVLTLVFLTYLSKSSFVVINGIKAIIGSLANLVALLIFMYRGLVRWDVAIPLAAGMFIGGFLGQKLIKYLKPSLVRGVTAAFSVVLAAYLAASAWF